MGMLGSWDGIRFMVTDETVMRADNLKRKQKARISEYEGINDTNTKIHFNGMEPAELSFSIELNALLGKRPVKTSNEIDAKMKQGRHAPFILGRKQIGRCDWMISSKSDAYEIILSRGEVLSAKLDITMKEYH
ncbi:MAG: phage tail protein [Eubacteriales bacterium]|nr:phage tail protein [Eubacteriales bacterium]